MMRQQYNVSLRCRDFCLAIVMTSFFAAAGSVAVRAGDMILDEGGVLNPSTYTLEGILLKVKRNELSDIECIYGYETAKHGKHARARVILRYCAEKRKLPQAMTLLAWMDENGYALEGGPDLVSAAKWDRRAAELGDWNAQYNYGLKLLQGRGVPQDVREGRRYIDLAAANGDRAAQELVANNYKTDKLVEVSERKLPEHHPAQNTNQ